MLAPILGLTALALLALAHTSEHQHTLTDDDDALNPHTFLDVLAKYGPQVDLPFSGPLSFAHLPYSRCLDPNPAPGYSETPAFDIAVLGMPFDTSVSYRPGARFGPFGIRAGSRRIRPLRSWTMFWEMDPYGSGVVLDCGDVPVAISDNALALSQMEAAYDSLLARPTKSNNISHTAAFSKDGREHPRVITLGGDHTVVLPILRSLNKVYGPVTVIHFDSHLDTWTPVNYPGVGNDENSISAITHGSFFWKAWKEGLMTRKNVHGGIRCKFSGPEDLENDDTVGFALITTDDIESLGTAGIARAIRDRVGDGPVYLSVDIDVIDPALAPATGTPEAGGWTVREFKAIPRGLAGLNFVGADIVEVAPAYDTNAETTSLIAADIVHEYISMFSSDAPVPERTPEKRGWTKEGLWGGRSAPAGSGRGRDEL